MPLTADKTRITGEIDRYLAGRHDADKVRVGRSCRAAVDLTRSYAELTSVLGVYKDELDRLVGNQNARRWFKHKAGDLHGVLATALARCVAPTRAEAQLFTVGRALPNKTETDWHRLRGGVGVVVNGRGFTVDTPTIADIRAFLLGAGIASARIREYLCDYANQNGLFSAGHLFAAMAAGKGVPVSFAGMRHTFTSRGGQTVVVHDEADFEVMAASGTAPVISFVQDYALVDDGARVVVEEARFSFANTDRLSPPIRTKVESSLDSLPM